MKSYYLEHWIFFVLICDLLLADPTLSGPPNEFWKCDGCNSYSHSNQVFGLIRRSIMRDERVAFLTLDMSWVNKILEPDSGVDVLVLNTSAIGEIIVPYSNNDKRFRLIVVEYNGYSSAWSADSVAQNQGYLKSFPEVALFPDTDKFLLHNPCWVPLSEPFGKVPKQLLETSSNLNSRKLNSAQIKGYWKRLRRGMYRNRGDMHLILAELPSRGFKLTCKMFSDITQRQFPVQCPYDTEHMVKHDLSNIGFTHIVKTVLFSFIHSTLIQSQSKIFVMPAAEQFLARPVAAYNATEGKSTTSLSGWSWAEPSTCAMSTQLNDPWACNFLSLSNCSNRLKTVDMPDFRSSMWETPCKYLQNVSGLAITDGERVRYHDSPHFSEEQWAKSRLNAFLQRPNIWLRYLIRKSIVAIQPIQIIPSVLGPQSLSRISAAPAATAAAASSTTMNGEGVPYSFVRAERGSSDTAEGSVTLPYQKSTDQPGDALKSSVRIVPHGLQDQQWEQEQEQVQEGNTNLEALRTAQAAPPRPRSPCIAIHVRHNDALLEERRAASGVDRSLAAHVNLARNLSEALGIDTFFLATDNVTVVEAAATLSEFTWYTQRRPLARHAELFLMFTKPYASESLTHNVSSGLGELAVDRRSIGSSTAPSGVRASTGGGRNASHLRQSIWADYSTAGVQADLSHILADIRFPAAACHAIVGSFDSALTAEIYSAMCSVGSQGRGRCPPSLDLR